MARGDGVPPPLGADEPGCDVGCQVSVVTVPWVLPGRCTGATEMWPVPEQDQQHQPVGQQRSYDRQPASRRLCHAWCLSRGGRALEHAALRRLPQVTASRPCPPLVFTSLRRCTLPPKRSPARPLLLFVQITHVTFARERAVCRIRLSRNWPLPSTMQQRLLPPSVRGCVDSGVGVCLL